MVKVRSGRTLRVRRQSAAASARGTASTSHLPATSLLATDEWTQMEKGLDGLVRIECPSSLTDFELLCPKEVWLVVDLAFVCASGDASSLRLAVLRAVDSLSQLCCYSETLRTSEDLYTAFWNRVATSKMCQGTHREDGAEIADLVRFTKARGLHVALRWHGRNLHAVDVADPLSHFLAATTGSEDAQHKPVQIALRLEQCQLTVADLQRVHELLKVRSSDDPTCTRLSDQTVLQQLSLNGNALFSDHLEALRALLEDRLTRRIDSLCLGDTIPQDTDLPDAYSAIFQRTLAAALCAKPAPSPVGRDTGVCLSIDECKALDSRLIDGLQHALVHATRPIRALSLACTTPADAAAVVRLTRLVNTTLPMATRDFELDLSCANGARGREEFEQALFESLGTMVVETTPRIRAAIVDSRERERVTCRLRYADLCEDAFLQAPVHPIERVSTTAFYEVLAVHDNGSFQIVLADGAAVWLDAAAIVNICIDDKLLVGSNCSHLILDGAKYGIRHGSGFAMASIVGATLTQLAFRNGNQSFPALPLYLALCPVLIEVNVQNGGPRDRSANYKPIWLSSQADAGATLQALNVANCGLGAASLQSLPPLPGLRYLQLADNPLKAKGLEYLLERLRASPLLHYVNVSSDKRTECSGDDQSYNVVNDQVIQYLQGEYVSDEARVAFLSVVAHL